MMYSVYLIACVTLVYSVIEPPSDIPTTVLRKLLQRLFSNYTCLVFISDNDKPSTVFAKAITEIKIPTISISSKKIDAFDVDTNHCRGYIISVKKATTIYTSFVALRKNQFGQNKRFVVLNDDPNPLETKLSEAYKEGISILKVQSFNDSKLLLSWNEEKKILNEKTKIEDFEIKMTNKPVPQGKFRIALFNCPPDVVYDETTSSYSGFEYKMLNQIVKDWTVEYLFYKEIISGNNLWDTIIKKVVDKETDISICSLWQMGSINEANAHLLSLTYPTRQSCYTLLVPKPKLLSDDSYIFQPMQWKTWLTIAITIILGSKVLQLASIFSRYTTVYNSVLESFFRTVQIFTNGVASKLPPLEQLPVCCVFVSFSIAFLLLSTTYGAGFSSILTYPRFSKPINTIDDLIENDIEVEVLSRLLHFSRKIFKSSSNPSIRLLANFLVAKNRIQRKDMAAKLVRITGPRYITNTENYTEYEKTQLHTVKGCPLSMNNVMDLQYKSPYLDYFNGQIIRLREHGFELYWYNMATSKASSRYMNNFYTTYNEYYFEHKPLNLSKIVGALFILAGGYLCSLIIFIAEVYSHERNT